MADEDFILRLVLDVRDSIKSAKQIANAISQVNEVVGSNHMRRAEKDMAAFGGTSARAVKILQNLAAAEKQRATAAQRAIGIEKANADLVTRLNAATRATRTLGGANKDLHPKLATTRYALYDVARGLGIAGAAFLGLTTAVYGTSIAMERQFANVVRVVSSGANLTSNNIATLRRNFIDLAGTIPIAFDELARIGTLGGQLGINPAQLSAFTSVVARFAAVTNLSVDEAATAFGRLKALLPDVADGSVSLEQLASAILRVGTNSVATESEITRVAVQISSMAKYAGLGARDIIALSGALASVGVQPELARGTITRLFTLIGRSASENGAKLQKFADVAGVSAEEFKDSFGKPAFGAIFLKLINGLNGLSDPVATLRQLGITSVRDVPALLRLAGAANSAGEAGQLLNQTFGDATTSIKSGTELTKQYGIIANTVASKIQIFANNFNNLVGVIGGGGGIIGGALDGLNEMLRTLTNLAQNPITQWVAGGVLVLSGLLGVIALVTAAVVTFVAGMIAIRIALYGISESGGIATLSLRAVTTEMIAAGGAAKVAGYGMRALSVAMKALGVVGVALIGIEVGKWLVGASRSAAGLSDDLGAAYDRLTKFGDAGSFGLGGYKVGEVDTSGLVELHRSLEGGGAGLYKDIASVDKGLAELAKTNAPQAAAQLEAIRKIYTDAGWKDSDFNKAFIDSTSQLKLSAAASDTTVNALGNLGDAQDLAAQQTADLAASLSLDPEGFDAYHGHLVDLIGSTVDFSKAIQQATKSGIFSLSKFNKILLEQVKAREQVGNNVLFLTAKGVSTGVIDQINAADPSGVLLNSIVQNFNNSTGQATLAAFGREAGLGLVDGVASGIEDGQSLIIAAAKSGQAAADAMLKALQSGDYGAVQDVIKKYNLTLSDNPIVAKIVMETQTAQNTLRNFISRNTGQRIVIGVNSPRMSANGGYIRGPGSGTSDSIPARLSNGEYVIKASSVRRYGQGMFDALNRGTAQFAAGGPVRVGGGAGSSAGGGSGYVINATVVQNYPTTRDPIKKLKQDAQSVIAGIWT